jgi:hypothetical protein
MIVHAWVVADVDTHRSAQLHDLSCFVDEKVVGRNIERIKGQNRTCYNIPGEEIASISLLISKIFQSIPIIF